MAESYRGLTIRIGGDTTKLTKALKVADSTIAGTRSEIRKLDSALKLDPGNIEAFNLKMGYMEQQATAASMKLYQLKQAAEEIASEGVDLGNGKKSVETVEELAAATENAHLRAQQMKASFNQARDSIAEMYTKLSEYNQTAAEQLNNTFGKSFAESIDIESTEDDINALGESLKSFYTEFKSVVEQPKKPLEESIAKLNKFREDYEKAETTAQKSKLIEKFEKLRNEITKINGLKIDYASGKTDLSDVEAALKMLAQLEGFDPSRLVEFREEVKRLKVEYANATTEVQKANAVARYADLLVEIQKAEAGVNSLAKAMANMREPSTVLRGMHDLTEAVDALGESYKNVTATAKSLESAFSINPDNIEAQEAAMRSWADAETTAIERAKTLKTQIDAFDREEIDQYTDATKSVQQQLIDAATAHAEAEKKVSKYKGAVEAAQFAINQLGLDARETAKILEGAGFDGWVEAEKHDKADLEAWEQQIIQLIARLNELNDTGKDFDGSDMAPERSKALSSQISLLQQLINASHDLVAAEEEEERTAKEFDHAQQRRDLTDLDAKYVQVTGDIDAARVAQQKLAAGDIKPHIDTTEIDRLKDVEKEIKDYGSTVGKQFNDLASDISVLGPITDDLSKRATDLMVAFTNEPDNIDALELGMRAIDEATAGCVIRAEQLKEIISGYEAAGIDKVADETTNVGLNAERAAHRVSEISKQIDAATRRANEFGEQYSKAVKSAEGSKGGATNPHVAELKRQFDEAVAEVERLRDAEEEALAALDTANAVSELVGYREELARVGMSLEKLDSLVKNIASSVAKSTTSNFIDAVFGGFDEKLGTFDSSMSTIQKRVKTMGDAMKVFPEHTEIAKQRMVELANAVELGEAEIKSLELVMKSIKDDIGANGFADFEGFTGAEAVDGAERKVESLVVQLTAAKTALAGMDESSEGFNVARARVDALEKELKEAREASVYAAAYQKWEMYGDKINTVRNAVQGFKNELYSIDANILDKAVQSAEGIKTAFGENMFSDVSDQFGKFNDVVEDAKRRIQEIDDQLELGKDDDALAERQQQVTRALSAMEAQAKLVNDAMSEIGLDSKATELINDYGGITEAVNKLSDEVVQSAAYMESFRKIAAGVAAERGLGQQWLDDFMDLKLTLGEIPDELRDVYRELQEVSERDLDNKIDLGIAVQIQYLESLRKESSQTFESIRQNASQKIQLKVDDTDIKNIRTLIKDATSESFDTLSFKTTGFDDFQQGIRYIDAALKGVSTTADDLKEKVKFDPANTALMTSATDAFRQKVVLLNEKLKLSKQLLEQLKGSGIEYASMSMGELATKTEATKARIAQLDDIAQRLSEATKDAVEEFERLNNAGKDTSAVKARLDTLREGIEDVKDETKDCHEELKKLGNATLFNETRTSVATTEAAIRETNRSAKELGDGFKNAFGTATMQAVQQIGQAAERVASKVVDSANTIDAAYRDMRKTVNGTEAEFGALLDSAVEFSQTHAVTADTILEMEALGGQLGITVDKLQEFGEVASNLDIATDISAEDIALQLGQITNIMSDLDYDTFQNFGDALVRLGNNMPTTESAIMDVAQRMAAVANVTSMSTPDLLAWSAAIASTGQRSESAATAINKTITGIGTAVAAGGETLNQFAAIAQMSAEEFTEAWKNSSSETLEAFVKGLATLTDDSTEAIQALDSVGISGVRQETALLSLSQTIKNLDDATVMASNAFNGISDKWGKAGDAANEANNKSQGFSGTLQILKNNASALAASLGDALVEPMKLAASILGMLTDTLNSMGGPMKTFIVTIGGLSAVLGTTLPAVQALAEGWEKFAVSSATVQKASGLVTAAIAKLSSALGVTQAKAAFMTEAYGEQAVAATASAAATGAGTTALNFHTIAATAAAGATELFSKALMAIPGVAVIAAITAAFTTLVDVLGTTMKRAEEIRNLANATAEASNAANTMKAAYSDAVSGINVAPVRQSLQELRDETSALISDLTEFENGVTDVWKEIGTDNAYVDEYASKIKELGNSGGLTKERLAELKNAVSEYNSITGASVQITNEQTGALNVTTEALDQVTDAYKRQAEAKAYNELYNETVKKQVEIKEELAEKQEKLNKLTEKYGVDLGNGSTWMLWYYNEAKELESQISLLSERQVNYNKRIKEYSEHLDVANGKTMSYEAALVSAGMEIETFNSLSEEEKKALAKIQSTLVDAGTSLKDYGDLTVEQIRTIIDAWDGTPKSVENAIKAMSSNAEGSLEVVTKATDEQYNHIKDLYDQLNTEQKRIRDDFYDNEKQRLDDNYEDQKRVLDDEYDLRKHILDKEYDDRKTELDDEYDATKESLDKVYDLRKRELDKEYSLKKRELDKSYDATKDSLDKEYDAAKDASDQWLKEYKRAQEAETKAFKDATDARVKEIDREYDAKKKLLNAEYEGYDSDIDDRIKAIEAEQDAEDKALKEQERQEKLAELGKAVETAKGTKKREEAEKALQDYKDELAREDVKAQRQAQIDVLNEQKDALKEQLSSREDHLKETYDAVKEEYKNERDAMLDALKESQSDEYDAVKASEDAKLQVIKDNNSAKLEEIKLANEDVLSDLKLHHQDILAALKEDNEEQLKVAKRRNELELEDLKYTNDEKLKALKRSHEDELEDLKLSNENILKILKRGHEDELTVIKNGYDATLRALKDGTISYEAALEGIVGKTIDNISKMGDAAKDAADTAINNATSSAAGKFSKTMDDVTKSISESDKDLAATAQNMLKNGQTTLSSYVGIVEGSAWNVSESVRNIFKQSGIELGTGLGAIAQQMLSNEQITLGEYLDIINGVPGSVGAVCNETGLRIANELGLVQPNVKASSQGVADGIKAPFDALPGYMKDAAVPNTVNAIAEGIGSQDTVTKLGKSSTVMYNAVTKTWTDVSKENSPKLATAMVGDVVGGVVDAADTGKGAMNPLYSTLMNDFTTVSKENSPKVGGNLAKDIASGVASGKEDVGKGAEVAASGGIEVLSKKSQEYEKAGAASIAGYGNGFGEGGKNVVKTAGNIGDSVTKSVDRKDAMKTIGSNDIIGFLNGLVETFNNKGPSIITSIADSIVNIFKGRHEVNSPSRLFGWIAEMDATGYKNEWLKQARGLVSSVGDVAQDMSDEMSDTSFEEPSLTFDAREGEREYAAFKDMLEKRERLLEEHTLRMEELSRTLGDIQLPMAAAYDAMGRINSAKASSVHQTSDKIDNSTYAPVININIPEVVVREEADIDRLSQQIALRVQRSLNARIG